MGRPRKPPEEGTEPTEGDVAEAMERLGLEEADLEPDLDPVDALELRVAELEARVAEAGRRALFHAKHGGGRISPVGPILEEVGRALLFDTETPDAQAQPEEVELGLVAGDAGVSGSAEVDRLGGDAA